MNNQDTRSNNQIISANTLTPFSPLPMGEGAVAIILSRVRVFGNWLLKIGICLVIVSWLLVIGQTSFAKEVVLPNYTGFVNDFAGVLDLTAKEKIEKLCRILEKKTSAELAIAVVKSTAPLDSKTYAVKLFEKWKIGKKGKDNGVLILLAMEEHRVEIEVGYGLEGVITDARAGEILDKEVIPYLRKGGFGEGLYQGALALAQLIVKNQGEELGEEYVKREAETEKGWPEELTYFVVISVIFLIFLSIFASGLVPGVFGAVFGAIFGYIIAGGIIGAIIGAIVGFMLSFNRLPGTPGGFGWYGGGWSGDFGGGGGFGFGGGSSGGGGAGRSW